MPEATTLKGLLHGMQAPRPAPYPLVEPRAVVSHTGTIHMVSCVERRSDGHGVLHLC